MFAIFKGWSIDGACPFRIVVGKVDDDASKTTGMVMSMFLCADFRVRALGGTDA